MPQINVKSMSQSCLYIYILPPPDYLIIIVQSDCFGITLLNFAEIKSCLRFGARAVCQNTTGENMSMNAYNALSKSCGFINECLHHCLRVPTVLIMATLTATF